MNEAQYSYWLFGLWVMVGLNLPVCGRVLLEAITEAAFAPLLKRVTILEILK